MPRRAGPPAQRPPRPGQHLDHHLDVEVGGGDLLPHELRPGSADRTRPSSSDVAAIDVTDRSIYTRTVGIEHDPLELPRRHLDERGREVAPTCSR
jgi:hypothetical protein